MRPVALRHILTTIALILAVSACASSPAAKTSATRPVSRPTVSQPSATIVGVPMVNSGGTCNETTIPAFAPDFSKSAPVPGGGRTVQEIWKKVHASFRYVDNQTTPFYNPVPEFTEGLPFDIAIGERGVICPDGKVFITDTTVFGAIITNAQFVNRIPNGGPPIYPGGRLYSHTAREVIGDKPCLALVVIDEQVGETTIKQAVFDGNAYVVCTSNGSFWLHPTQK
jgi:hypothetical protein